jgi:plasmid stabilization system protein ParE
MSLRDSWTETTCRDIEHEVEHLRQRTQRAEALARSLRDQVEAESATAASCRRQMELMQVRGWCWLDRHASIARERWAPSHGSADNHAKIRRLS